MKRISVMALFTFLSLTFAVVFMNVASAGTGLKDDDRTKSARSSAAAPAASTTLVISQVYSGGGGSTGTYLNDYVEIKNVSATSQSLNGLSLVYGSATGNFGSAATLIFALPNVSLNPGQYYLVQTSNPGSAGAPLPVTPDSVTTNLSMAAAGGKVIIANSSFTVNTCGATANPCTLPNAGIIDLVAWGTGNNAEGGTSVNGGVGLISTQGSVRKTAGCTDTDNNNADFDVVTAPVPRNTATTPAICGAAPATHTYADFNGDGKTDWAITRNSGGNKTWWVQHNGAAGGLVAQFGIDTDVVIPVDFDGDSKADVSVWREAAAGQAAFYILQSTTNTVRIELFGQTGDRPTSVGDYDGDGKADPSVYRAAAAPGGQSYFYYRGSLNNPGGNVTYIPWGTSGDIQTSGDFDGDGKFDVCVFRNGGGGQGLFILRRSSDLGVEYVYWGTSTDNIVPGDYDGDGKSDFAVARLSGGNYNLYILERDGGGTGATPIAFALEPDYAAFGDYDGDGKQDIAIWREGNPGVFWVRQSSNGAVVTFAFGQIGDNPVYEWNLTGGIN